MKKETYDLKLTITRYGPEKGHYSSTFRLAVGGILRIVDVFRKINAELDSTLAWRSSCEHAQCGSCTLIINREPVLSCKLLVETAVEHFGTENFHIEPMPLVPVLRDLVIDFRYFENKILESKPWLIEPAPDPLEGDEYRVPPEELAKYEEATRCINCFTCRSGCPTQNPDYYGPNLLMQNYLRLLDPREGAKAERLKYLFDEKGLLRCRTGRFCTIGCPKEIPVSEFLAQAKAYAGGATTLKG
ncbi:succinate dehydrogenase/fumarate reductase iron-sulfur subunit [candidate division CSSED10-310 bacterium]|uniref:succinate dehydrogenase n=1 Tax=candidate division CSSED10-310 bacterium TaxID=2855610 RepID=A0ABV6Z146_UNCC1